MVFRLSDSEGKYLAMFFGLGCAWTGVILITLYTFESLTVLQIIKNTIILARTTLTGYLSASDYICFVLHVLRLCFLFTRKGFRIRQVTQMLKECR